MTIEYLDNPQPGWFVLDVVRATTRKWDWFALMVDVDPTELKKYQCNFLARSYVHPKQHRPEGRKVNQRWLRIPGKHRNGDVALRALQDLMETTALTAKGFA